METKFHLKPGEQSNISEGEYNSSSDENYVDHEESSDYSRDYASLDSEDSNSDS